jgi:cellulose synthase/poly-beta-1,6-N-acetylglucosamine synthase-like glycosyltransferase
LPLQLVQTELRASRIRVVDVLQRRAAWEGDPVMAIPDDAVWCVVVLAHNEEASIAATLESLPAAADGHWLDVFVLVNGCTDRTEAIVDAHARRDPAIHPVTIALGDKRTLGMYMFPTWFPRPWSTSSLMAMCSRFHSERRKMSRAC